MSDHDLEDRKLAEEIFRLGEPIETVDAWSARKWQEAANEALKLVSEAEAQRDRAEGLCQTMVKASQQDTPEEWADVVYAMENMLKERGLIK